MKILDAGTSLLDDRDVLAYIRDKEAQHVAYAQSARKADIPKTKRPANFLRALKKHSEHLSHAERPFKNNDLYDDDSKYLTTLMQKLEPKVQLTKTELLMLVNHRPHKREFLLPMVEDVEARFSEDQQQWIVDTVVEVLGRTIVVSTADEPVEGAAEQEDGGDAMET